MAARVDRNGNFQVIAARAIVVSADNKILLVSERDIKWHLPGGWTEILEHPLACCEREVYEETGMVVKAEKIVHVSEYLQKPGNGFKESVQKFGLYCVCSIVGDEDIKHDWQDHDNSLIQHRRFVDDDEWQNGPDIYATPHLRQMSIADIKKLPNCYSLMI